MPHLIIEYSANLEDQVDIAGLLRAAHDAALATRLFAVPRLQSRATRYETYHIADGNPANAFIHVTLRMGYGRDQVTKQRVGEDILAALDAYLAPTFARTPLSVSLEMTEFDPMLNFERCNLAERVYPQ